MNLSEIALRTIQRVFLLLRHASLLLDQFGVLTLELHQLIDDGSKMPVVRLRIQTLGDLRDPWLQAGFCRLILFHLAPCPGSDRATLFLSEAPPLLKQL